MSAKKGNKYEVWNVINENYDVSNLGRIRSNPRDVRHKNGKTFKNRGKILKQVINNMGYYVVNIAYKNKIILELVHRLIAKAFIPNPFDKRTINHKNGIKTDNRIENMEWATDSENVHHAYDVLGRDTPRGLDNGRSRPVVNIYSGICYYSINEAALMLGYNRNTLYSMLTGKNPNKTDLRL